MSKNAKTVFAVIPLILLLLTNISAAKPEVSVSIGLDEKTGSWSISGKINGDNFHSLKNVSFLDTYADLDGLAARITNLTVTDAFGKQLPLKKFNNGEYVSSAPYFGFSYQIMLTPPTKVISSPHVSWYSNGFEKEGSNGRALLKLQDILPDIPSGIYRIRFDLPDGWQISSAGTVVGGNTFVTNDFENSVFLTGKDLRLRRTSFSGVGVSVALADKWQFDDSVVSDMTLEILKEYQKLFGSMPVDRIQINLLKFPVDIGKDRWRAETQGSTITIVSSDSTYKNLAEQRLHEQLRHELFHLWIPEAVQLEGEYAWFYEGFAQYQSLKAGVWVGRLRFEDFLRSMSEAINIAAFDESTLSLPELSKSRWQTGPGVVAARGMAVAFLCDAVLLAKTKRKKNIGKVLSALFDRYRTGEKSAADARTAIERELLSYPYLRPVVDLHINANRPVEWESVLAPFGIKANSTNRRVLLETVKKPNRSQKALLNNLGYNRWKILPRS